MHGTRLALLSISVAAVLMSPLAVSPALAEGTPNNIPSPVETTAPTSPPEITEPDVPPTSEAPEPTGTPAPTEAPESANAPAPSGPAPTESGRTAEQGVEAFAATVNDVPSISIDLPDPYTLDQLNASKDEIPADPDTEDPSMLDLVDPANPANNLTDVALEEIKGRGNFTWLLEKKPYQIKFDIKTPVLGMETAKTWILLANHADPSLLRNKVAYDLANEFGIAGSPDSRFVDLTIEGEYLGSYLLSEKVEVKTNRLELSDPGGILLELDNNYGLEEDFHFTTTTSNTLFVLKDAVQEVDEPLPPELASAYADIQDYLNEFESYLYAPDPDWAKISAMIDVDSFIKYYFVFEVAENPEITQSSVFFWRDGVEPDDKLHAGPVWDFDSAFAEYVAESLGGDPRQDYIKNAQFLRDKGNGWFTQLFRNPEFVREVNRVFDTELKPKIDALPSKIDAYAAAMPLSAAANFERWNVLGQPSVFSGGHTIANTWQGEVDYLRNWVATRVAHLNSAHGQGNPFLTYATHVADIGWQPGMTQGQIAGTVGSSLQVEALDIALLDDTLEGTIQSKSHVQNIGWSSWQSGDTRLGTTGRALQVEALQFRLTEQLAANYDVSYRVHVQNIGWMPWAKNGATAGTTGRGLQVEALQIRLLEKADSVSYSAHVSNIGWMSEVSDGAVAGTTGRALAMEALEANVISGEYSGGIRYRAHVQNIGWMAWTDSPGYIGTVGRGLRMEALQLQLTGDLALHYTLRYSAHVQDIGWQPWVVDGQTAGTTGQAKRAEAIKIELVPKP